MKKIATYSLIGLFIVLNILDVISTLLNYYKNPKFNELNPVFLLTDNIWISLVIMKCAALFIVFFYFYMLKRKRSIITYAIVLLFILVNILLLTVVINNFKIAQDPQLSIDSADYVVKIAKQENITENEFKWNYYKETSVYPIWQSFALILLIFVVFQRIEKENNQAKNL